MFDDLLQENCSKTDAIEVSGSVDFSCFAFLSPFSFRVEELFLGKESRVQKRQAKARKKKTKAYVGILFLFLFDLIL